MFRDLDISDIKYLNNTIIESKYTYYIFSSDDKQFCKIIAQSIYIYGHIFTFSISYSAKFLGRR